MSTVLVIDCVHNDLPDDLLAHSTYGLDALLHDATQWVGLADLVP